VLHLQALHQAGRIDVRSRVQVAPGETVVVLMFSNHSFISGEALRHVGLPC
jgi:hypothetical protein